MDDEALRERLERELRAARSVRAELAGDGGRRRTRRWRASFPPAAIADCADIAPLQLDATVRLKSDTTYES